MNMRHLRWSERTEWSNIALTDKEWAPLQAQVYTDDPLGVEACVDEVTGFMDSFTTELDGLPLAGVTDGQLSVSVRTQPRAALRNSKGGPGDGFPRGMMPALRAPDVVSVMFYAAGPVHGWTPHAFSRLSSAARALVEQIQTEGISVHGIEWVEHPYVRRAF